MEIFINNQAKHDIVYTCDDTIHANIIIQPYKNRLKTLLSVKVHFIGRVRTKLDVLDTSTRRTYEACTYLFEQTKEVLEERPVTINARHTWDIGFQFPCTVTEHQSQQNFESSPHFAHQHGHCLPPGWKTRCFNHNQLIEYYLELIVIHRTKWVDCVDKRLLPLQFIPNLRAPVAPLVTEISTFRSRLVCKSPRLDPKWEQPQGLFAKVKAMCSSEPDPIARFAIAARAPKICYFGDCLPVKLSFKYEERFSTASIQPEVKIASFYVRIAQYIRIRVPGSSMSSLPYIDRENKFKVHVGKRLVKPALPVFDGMAFDELISLQVKAEPTFMTFSASRSYMLKISAEFECGGRKHDLVLLHHPLLVRSSRNMHRSSCLTPPPILPIQVSQVQARDWQDQEKPPPYSP